MSSGSKVDEGSDGDFVWRKEKEKGSRSNRLFLHYDFLSVVSLLRKEIKIIILENIFSTNNPWNSTFNSISPSSFSKALSRDNLRSHR